VHSAKHQRHHHIAGQHIGQRWCAKVAGKDAQPQKTKERGDGVDNHHAAPGPAPVGEFDQQTIEQLGKKGQGLAHHSSLAA
jgi:hypothetical protein